MSRKLFCLFIVWLVIMGGLKAQKGLLKTFIKTPYPEKIWVMKHLFCVRKAFSITQKIQHIAEEMKNDRRLDGDGSGGQVDACRHAAWMALLFRAIGEKRALSLGKAHEKSNYVQYKRRTLEDATTPDSISSEMDFRNNKIGIEIAKENPDLSESDLIEKIKQYVLSGRMWKIKKDSLGNYLDWNNKILIQEDYWGKWNNAKCLIKSNS